MKGKEGQRPMLSDRDPLGKQGDVLSSGIQATCSLCRLRDLEEVIQRVSAS